MAKQLIYEITTDPSKGIAGLKQFSSAVKKSMKDVADSVDEPTTNAQKLAKVLAGMADDLETEMKKAAKAADALGKALGPEISQRTDLDSVVQDLKKMGISFDEITTDADALAASLKKLDQVQLSGAGRGMEDIADSSKRAKQGVDDIGKSADSSKSVLANMIGNSVQDLGALGGVAGSAGVAIGQMGEYMADAAGSGDELGKILSNFAGVAGPIAALAAATAFFQGVMAKIAKQKAFNTDEIKAFSDALNEGGDQAAKLEERLRTAGAIKFEAPPSNAWNFWFGNAQNAIDLMDQAGVSVERFTKGVTGSAQDADDLYQLFRQAAQQGLISQDALRDSQKLIEQYFKNFNKGVSDLAKKNDVLAVSQNSVNDAVKEMLESQAPLSKFPDEFGRMSDALAAHLAPNVKDVQTVMEGLGVSEQDALDIANSLAQTKLDNFAKQTAEAEENFQKAAEAVKAYNDAIQSADWKAAGLEGATTAMQKFSDAQFGAADAILDVESAIDDLGKTWKDTGVDIKKTKFGQDFATENGRKNQQAIEQLARAVDEQLGPAFADAGGDFNKFKENAERITQQALGPLRDEFHISKTQVEELRKQLGLTTGDFEVKFKLSGDEEAKVKLGLLQSAIEGLDKPTQMKIGAQVSAGDVQGAVKTAQDAFNDPNNQVNMQTGVLPPSDEQIGTTVAAVTAYMMTHPMPTMPIAVSLDDTEFHRQIKALQDFIRTQKFTATDNPFGLDAGGTAGGFGGIAGERGPEIINSRYLVTGPTYIPPGTRVTSRKRTEQILRVRGHRGLRRYDSGGVVPTATTINVNAAVIGSTFDVMNAVNDAVRRANRLLPRHQ